MTNRRTPQRAGARGAKAQRALVRGKSKGVKTLREETIAFQMLCRACSRQEVIAHLMSAHELNVTKAERRVAEATRKLKAAAEADCQEYRGEALARYREIIRIALLARNSKGGKGDIDDPANDYNISAQMLAVAKAAQERIDKLTGAEAAVKVDARVATFDLLEVAKELQKLQPEDRAALIDKRLAAALPEDERREALEEQ